MDSMTFDELDDLLESVTSYNLPTVRYNVARRRNGVSEAASGHWRALHGR
jgi:hypothetical protein